MGREEVLRILAEHKEEIAARGVASISIFGSVARDEAGPGNDVDILVERSRPMGLFEYIGVHHYLEEILGRRVDLVMPDAIKTRLRDRILGEAIRAA